MTKEVSVSIEGLQLGVEEAPIILTASGTYHLHNEKHYVQYEEKSEEREDSIKNTIKIALTQVEMTRKVAGSSQMTFDLNETTEAIYQTPYGNLFFEVKTSKMLISEVSDKIQVKLEYSLYTNATPLSEHSTTITITPAI